MSPTKLWRCLRLNSFLLYIHDLLHSVECRTAATSKFQNGLQPSVSFQFCDVGKMAMVHKMILPHFTINDNESKKIEESFVYLLANLLELNIKSRDLLKLKKNPSFTITKPNKTLFLTTQLMNPS